MGAKQKRPSDDRAEKVFQALRCIGREQGVSDDDLESWLRDMLDHEIRRKKVFTRLEALELSWPWPETALRQ